MSAKQHFTAAQIARALGLTKRAVLAALRDATPAIPATVEGNRPAAWPLESLPLRFREGLARVAKQRGYGGAEHLLATPPEQIWPPPGFPKLSEIAQHCLDKAAKAQRALARVLALQGDLSRTSAELEQLGLEDYRREFGYAISGRALRALIKRTIERDGGAENFSRLTLYLDERPARKAPLPSRPRPGDEVEFRELREVIAMFKDQSAPTHAELEYLWTRAFEMSEDRVAAGKPEKRIRRALVRFLFSIKPTLAKHEPALRKTFKRHYAAWLKNERRPGWLDKRRTNSGFHRAPELNDEDRKLLTATAAALSGPNQAWQTHHRELSPAIREYYPGTHRCPARIRELIRHDVAMEKIALHGPHAMRTAGAFVNRNPNGIASGDWDQSDDMTMVNVWWDDAPDSPEGFWFGQGQLLVWIDERSWFAYGWDLISDPYYDAFSIRNSWNTKAATWGLPRKGLSLERGIWQTSRIVVGERVNRSSAVGILETASALERLGLRFHNATHARVKVIERIYGKLQNYFQAAPGYVGRNPITDRYERVQDQIRQVKAGKAHPSEFFLHKNQWASILDKVLLHYNDTRMDGKYHEGRSPKEVYQTEFTDKLALIPDELAHMFMDECLVRKVGPNGVMLPFGKRQFRYKGARLGELRGQPVRIYFRPSSPDIARCTDLKGQNPFAVELEARPFNHDPLPGTLEKAIAQNAAQDRYMKELHRSLKPYYNSDFFSNLFRSVRVDREAVERSQVFARQTEEINSRRADEQKRQTHLRRRAVALGVSVPARPKRMEQVADGLEWEAQIRQELERETTNHED